MTWEDNLVRDAGRIACILRQAHTIAVVGAKEGAFEPAFFVPRYLQSQGYRIIPVNPKFQTVLGQPCLASLPEVTEPVDIVNVFRAPHNLMPHTREALQLGPRVFWMQEGIAHGEAAQLLAEAGILVVQNRCIMRDHELLVAAGGEY